MGLYVDPMTDTGPFLGATLTRVPLLLLGQWGPIPAESASFLGGSMAVGIWWLAMGVLGLLLLAMAPLLRRDPLARFWAAGMVLAAIPVSATMPADRLLTFVGIGASGLLAQYWTFVFGGAAAGAPRRLPAKAMAWLLVAVHAVLAPIAAPLRAASPLGPEWVLDRLYVRTPLGPSLEGRTVVIVNAPVALNAGYLVLRRDLSGQAGPSHTRVLAPAMPHVTVRRLDERTLAIAPAGGYMRFVADKLFRSDRRPLAAGDRVELTGMTATITYLTPDGRPAEATFRFDVPLESASLLWLCFRGDGFEPFTPPAIGRAAEIRFDGKALLSPELIPVRWSR
jgi:hypothetical protein